jgi:hypothetical protein
MVLTLQHRTAAILDRERSTAMTTDIVESPKYIVLASDYDDRLFPDCRNDV